ncbi:extracellular solute-binding protein [Paenactinomyces guangxiensis]|uniref:Extracellular solute-binding protein n=1 Tax=Paenactinomyces guangxiensis TaxID=1490290 RepID=A0A7W1WPA0_9BACL|nr:extracellular solute-binding protein [Paenactinomyces guangxiensis]MBA4493485.1 extracellular solute-binding protein [Paenactinomyces guangxiensis]MBH8590576.1 extracellular solute-binding protein [Paenactinomyces guangxiensis]
MKKGLGILLSLALTVGILLTGCSSDGAGSGSPQKITVYTVAGGDEYYKDVLVPMFEKAMKGKYKVEYGRSTPQELINKIKAQGKNGNIDVVISGVDALPIGMKQGLWEQILPKYGKELHADELNELSQAYVKKFDGYGIPNKTGPAGPVLAYNKDKVKQPPKTYEELKQWVKKHPKKFMYAAVPSSGPSRAFFFGLAQSMGEDYNKVESLNKTWSYLEEIGQNIDLYPSKTSDSFNYLYDGTVDIIPHSPLWAAMLKATGTLPPNIGLIKLTDAKTVVDSHFYVMPKDLPEDRKKAALEFIGFALSKEAQAQQLATGAIPSNKNATPDLILPQYKDDYKKIIDSVIPEFKDGDMMIIPKGDGVLFPDPDPMNQIYKTWEEKIQSKK